MEYFEANSDARDKQRKKTLLKNFIKTLIFLILLEL